MWLSFNFHYHRLTVRNSLIGQSAFLETSVLVLGFTSFHHVLSLKYSDHLFHLCSFCPFISVNFPPYLVFVAKQSLLMKRGRKAAFFFFLNKLRCSSTGLNTPNSWQYVNLFLFFKKVKLMWVEFENLSYGQLGIGFNSNKFESRLKNVLFVNFFSFYFFGTF